ncbi:MAG TPA: AgmX/PglI C-terminal domain-containing protein [Myxococcaceae bacterium]|nr:AgmX/PglI C-terminal domain-containing protein [Myxococcaceae bacterium]
MKRWILTAAMAAAPCAWAQQPRATDAGTAAPTAQAPVIDVSKMPFTQESVRKVVQAHQPQIQSCYEETMTGKSQVVEGKLKTSWVVTAEGLVKSAQVLAKGTTVRDDKLNECVVAVLTAMNFPKPPDGRDHPIEYPFNLKAIR